MANKKAHVLVIDDDPVVLRSFQRILADDFEVRVASTGSAGLSLLTTEPFDIALLDLKLPDIPGMDILRQAADLFPDVSVIIITGYSTVKSAVEAIKMGAFDYLTKPFTPDEIEAVVEKALRQRRLLKDYRDLQEALSGRYRVSHLIGESPAMRRVLALVDQVAQTDSTVLITGESGTGKELVARAIHFSSPRRNARFVAVDCGAIAPPLIASELFGHVRGAFTGASADRSGLIETAHHGTLFLDEISNLPLDLQATLLRVIETREVRAVGSSTSANVNVRYVAATNRDLQAFVSEGKFRNDLFYRLNVFPIHIPPLREHREDIPILARYFLAGLSAKMHKRLDDFTPEALRALMEYDWPGNVRELSNLVERLVILCGEGLVGQARVHQSLDVSALGSSVPQTVAELNEVRSKLREQAVDDIEKAFLLEALHRNGYNITKAAAQTGMQRSNFQALLKKHKLRIKDIVTRQTYPETGSDIINTADPRGSPKP